MNKLLIVAVVIVAIVIGWFLFTPDTIEYASVVEDEVASLEAEFEALETEIAAGTLSQTAAIEARSRIIARIEAIEAASVSSGEASLTDSQRMQLQNGLERLKTILITYQSTLIAVDEVAGVEVDVESNTSEERPLNRGGGGGRSLTVIAAGALESIDVAVEDIITDYVTEEEIEDLLVEDSAEMGTTTMETGIETIDEDETGSEDTSDVEDGDMEEVEETSTTSAADGMEGMNVEMNTEAETDVSVETEEDRDTP